MILLLGSFHTLLGAVGTLMDGSGLKEIVETLVLSDKKGLSNAKASARQQCMYEGL